MQLSVSIVLYNSPLDLLRRNLQSLQRAAEIAGPACRVDRVAVYIVDNSTERERREGARAFVSRWPANGFFQMNYVAQPGNRGFGAGHNSVIPRLDSDYHLVLNPDVELSEDALRVGLSTCKRYPSVFVLILRAFAPHFVRRIFHRRLERYAMRDVCSGDREAEILLASGCFMLVRTGALRAAGGFNDRYFLYFEDFDLSLRLGGQGRLMFNPAMRIVHHGGYAASKGIQHVKYFLRSGVTFFNQHGWRWI
jgi:GT2 family glycosyltransferase